MAIAIRRNMSSVAARDLSAVLCIDKGASRQVITLCEEELATALSAFGVSWHTEREELIYQSCSTSTSSSWAIAVHSFQCDATTSNVWQSSKLMSTQVTSGYLVGSSPCERLDKSHFDTRTFWCEVQRVADGTSV